MLGSMTMTPSVALKSSRVKFPKLPCAWSAAIVRKSATLVLSDEFMMEQEVWTRCRGIKERKKGCVTDVMGR